MFGPTKQAKSKCHIRVANPYTPLKKSMVTTKDGVWIPKSINIHKKKTCVHNDFYIGPVPTLENCFFWSPFKNITKV